MSESTLFLGMDEPWRLPRFNPRFAALMALCLLFELSCLCVLVDTDALVKLRPMKRVPSDSFGGSKDHKDSYGETNRRSWLGLECSKSDVVAILLFPCSIAPNEDEVGRRFLRVAASPSSRKARAAKSKRQAPPHFSKSSPSPSPSPSPVTFPHSPYPASESPLAPSFAASETPISSPSPNSILTRTGSTVFVLSPPASGTVSSHSRSKKYLALVMLGLGSLLVVFLLFIGIFYRSCKVSTVTVGPWATGLSGQLKNAFVTGVPKLKRSDLETACEDFSNVVGSSLMGNVFKGTLSDGVEIAVISAAEPSSNDWTESFEEQFRNKINSLSRVNHKNFVNLLGYCEEERPFTRMMVFEYAPNGTLFEHLHVKEAEHLDWRMRLRIAMGIAYSLEHIHQLTPPMALNNLNSSTINLTEDYAAKISDFSFCNEVPATSTTGPTGLNLMNTTLTAPENDVYNFGFILLEMVTGRLPCSVGDGSLEKWAYIYLHEHQPLMELLDPTLESFQEEQLERIDQVIRSCVHAEPHRRLAMTVVTASLSEITGIRPNGAIPRQSPLWWAEHEVLSAGSN